ncbi:type I restriction enzyme M protein [Pseudobutyrivibrio sp. OR37]|uniref:type I restriction-modification system subunit M n=1 Tax=Pseudobutyrivibrio sp. OR37 TaxID=1798186 RepID=UPI0008EBC064|nr:type I restriction-modification system subunit M [Pseudobutyrivibrio sp. OR37]SFH76309.1 type I restriction enzyme M protein [Pseudobutyrivibrio sp. OR37]
MTDLKELETVLWAGADVLRGQMDANEYKDYILGIIFFKHQSDQYLYKAYDLMYDEEPNSLDDAQKAYEEMYNSSSAEALLKEIKNILGYTLEPNMTNVHMINQINNHQFNREELQAAFNRIQESNSDYEGLFAGVNLYSQVLGLSDQKQSQLIADLMLVINKADLVHTDADVLGNAYEYLLGQFASETGKKAGEFYTPGGPAQIVSGIAMMGQEEKKGLQVYDPCMGSGSLLLRCKKYSKNPDYIKYYGQELMNTTYNLARMNMFLHGVLPENQTLRNGDTLDKDWPTTEETGFDCVVMNPPYSANWSANEGFMNDERFMDYGKLAPKSKADYAFLLHGFYHLKATGTMAIVLPHGVLFRGGAEGVIREKLLRDGSIYAVIGLPANMFYNTSIPTCIVVLKKHREGRDVLFVDASNLFEKNKKQNVMNQEHIDKVLELYEKRENIDRLAALVTYDEIEKNDFNLNIPRYVDTSEEEEAIDLTQLVGSIKDTNVSIRECNERFLDMLGELAYADDETKNAVTEFMSIVKEV